MQNQRGFTLIELLVVVAIIGILAAIVVTSTIEHRAAAQCAKVENDVRNATSALEAAFAKTESYSGVTLVSSPNVSLAANASGSDIISVTGSHPACRRGTYTYSGSTGQFDWISAS